MNTYTEDIVLGILPFTQQREGDDVIVGFQGTGAFLVIEPEAAALLEELASGKTVGEVSAAYEREHGQKPDLEDFLALLESKGVVARPGHGTEPQNSGAAIQEQPKRRYHFARFPQSVARSIFGAPALTFAFVLIALALAAVAHDHSLMPNPANLIFPDRLTLTWTILVILNIATVFLHEMAHLVAARAAGVESRIGIGNRLWYLVAETDLTGLWAIPKRQRYLPMLGGMLCDAVCASLLILFLSGQHMGLLAIPGFVVRVARAMTFTYLMAILWQFFLFMRTDIYFVIATAFNCRNLLSDTEVFLRNQLARFFPTMVQRDQSAIPLRELRVIRGYAFVWIAGRVWAVATGLWASIPVGLSYTRSVVAVVRAGYSANPASFIDSSVLAFYFLVPMVAGLVLWIRSFSARKRS